MSTVVSLRLKDKQLEALRRAARRLGRSPSETAVVLLEEALRQREFTFIQFRDSPVGRQAYLQGTRLAVWQVASLAQEYGGDAENRTADFPRVDKVAQHLGLPSAGIRAALHYAAAYPEEIEAAIADSACTLAELQRLIPNLEIVEVDAPPA